MKPKQNSIIHIKDATIRQYLMDILAILSGEAKIEDLNIKSPLLWSDLVGELILQSVEDEKNYMQQVEHLLAYNESIRINRKTLFQLVLVWPPDKLRCKTSRFIFSRNPKTGETTCARLPTKIRSKKVKK